MQPPLELATEMSAAPSSSFRLGGGSCSAATARFAFPRSKPKVADMSNADGSREPSLDSRNPTFSSKKSSPDLLRHVLEETLQRGKSGMSEPEWQAIRQIASEHRERQLSMDQITELLVAALLAARFPDLASQESRRSMCNRIAASLCGDPTSMQRLKIFWQQLCESVT